MYTQIRLTSSDSGASTSSYAHWFDESNKFCDTFTDEIMSCCIREEYGVGIHIDLVLPSCFLEVASLSPKACFSFRKGSWGMWSWYLYRWNLNIRKIQTCTIQTGFTNLTLSQVLFDTRKCLWEVVMIQVSNLKFGVHLCSLAYSLLVAERRWSPHSREMLLYARRRIYNIKKLLDYFSWGQIKKVYEEAPCATTNWELLNRVQQPLESETNHSFRSGLQKWHKVMFFNFSLRIFFYLGLFTSKVCV